MILNLLYLYIEFQPISRDFFTIYSGSYVSILLKAYRIAVAKICNDAPEGLGICRPYTVISDCSVTSPYLYRTLEYKRVLLSVASIA